MTKAFLNRHYYRILIVNSFHYLRGGDCKYTFTLSALLRNKGHRVVHFAMNHPLNFESEYSKYFVPEIDLAGELKKGGTVSGLKVLKRAIYSNISKKKLSSLLNNYTVDIAHIQNIHGHITPSIFHILKKKHIPIIWTLHDYFLLCPNSTFYAKNKVCEACKGNRFYNVVLNRCRKNSLGASIVVMLEEYIHRLMGFLKFVDYFITPSIFFKYKLIEYGFEASKVINIPHFIDNTFSDTATENDCEEDYIVYIGRLSYEKGLLTLLKAISIVNSVKLYLVGDGPMRDAIEQYVRRNNLSNKILLLGYIGDVDRLKEIIRKALFLVFPSECYETFGLSVVESYVLGKPVIGSKIGAIKEVVRDGETGILFESGNAHDLADKIRWLLNHPEKRNEMGKRAKGLVRNEYNAELHYERIMRVYRSALKRCGKL